LGEFTNNAVKMKHVAAYMLCVLGGNKRFPPYTTNTWRAQSALYENLREFIQHLLLWATRDSNLDQGIHEIGYQCGRRAPGGGDIWEQICGDSEEEI